MYDAAIADIGLDRQVRTPLVANRVVPAALFLASEWGIDDLESRLTAAVEEWWEPTWDRARGEFTWGLGLGEEHPRGQYNAMLAAAEACDRGAWTGLAEAPLERCPQVVGVDFPTVGLACAEWVGGTLHVRLAPLVDAPRERTTFEIVGLDEEQLHRRWHVAGVDAADVATTSDGLRVTLPMVSVDVIVGSADDHRA